jgi:hypothetical protein
MYVLIIFCIFFKVEACRSTYITIQKTWNLIQAHPKTSIFSIFTAGVAGIVFHSKYSTQTFKHVHDTEKLQRIRLQIRQAQEAAATVSAQETSKRAECQALRQEISLLRLLLEERYRANLITKVVRSSIRILASEKERYERECNKFAEQTTEWAQEKTRIEECYAQLKAQLSRLGSSHSDPSVAMPPIRIGSAGTRPHTTSASNPESQKAPVPIKVDPSFEQSLKQADARQTGRR